MTIYQSIKANLKADADRAKLANPTDKPYRRQVINDSANGYHREIDFYAMKGKFSEAKAEQYKNWLSSYAASLHP